MGSAVAGALVHDVVEFGRPALEGSVFIAVVLTVLVTEWRRRPAQRRVLASTLIGLSVIILVVGAGLAVVPLPIWPFEPEQTASHYVAHVIWGVMTLPVLALGARLRHSPGV